MHEIKTGRLEGNIKKIIDAIDSQNIRMIKNRLDATDKMGGMVTEESITTNLNIEITHIAEGTVQAKQEKESPILLADYSFNLQYFYKKDDLKIIDLQSIYRITLFLKEPVKNIIHEEEERREAVPVFFDNTGRIMVYPYFRHLSDILIRESGFVIPPLPPLKINPNE